MSSEPLAVCIRKSDRGWHWRALPRWARSSHLAFVGDGALRGALESSAAQLGVASRVHFSGRVTDASRYAAAFDAVVVASVPEEAFGMALLEAMLARVPVVCADVPGPRSVLGPDGLYFTGETPASLTDALRRCATLSIDERAPTVRDATPARRGTVLGGSRRFALPRAAQYGRCSPSGRVLNLRCSHRYWSGDGGSRSRSPR